VTATVTNGSESVVIQVSAEEDVVDGTVKYNGATVALIGGTLDEPTFTNPAGEPLSAEQREGLENLFEAVGSLFELADKLFSPAAG
jgi:hypothetical protein